jgi:hypothetical protein
LTLTPKLLEDLQATFSAASPAINLVNSSGKPQEVITIKAHSPNTGLLQCLGNMYYLDGQQFLLEIASPLQEVSPTGVSLVTEESVAEHRDALRESPRRISQRKVNATRPVHVLANHPKDIVAVKRALSYQTKIQLIKESHYELALPCCNKQETVSFCTFVTADNNSFELGTQRKEFLERLPRFNELKSTDRSFTLPCGDSLTALADLIKGHYKHVNLASKHVLVWTTALGPHALLLKEVNAETLQGTLRIEGSNLTQLVTPYFMLKSLLIRTALHEECVINYQLLTSSHTHENSAYSSHPATHAATQVTGQAAEQATEARFEPTSAPGQQIPTMFQQQTSSSSLQQIQITHNKDQQAPASRDLSTAPDIAENQNMQVEQLEEHPECQQTQRGITKFEDPPNAIHQPIQSTVPPFSSEVRDRKSVV